MCNDEKYVENMFTNWESAKKEIRKELPRIYKESDDEVKIIISMLVESEYENSIKLDNMIRKNARERNETTDRDVNADNYRKENEEIMELLNADRRWDK